MDEEVEELDEAEAAAIYRESVEAAGQARLFASDTQVAACRHKRKDWSNIVLDMMPPIYTWTCVDCGFVSHEQ